MLKNRARLVCLLSFLVSCQHHRERELSQEEMKRLGLSGIIQDAEACPIEVNHLGQSKVVGDCEWVSCQSTASGVLKCIARPKK